MSHIAFRTPGQSALVGGRERAYLAHLVWRLTRGLLDLESTRPMDAAAVQRWHSLLRRYEHGRDREVVGDFETALHVAYDGFICAGRQWDPFRLQMNTALQFGSDDIRLAARVHGQCEVHGWVAGPNRAWLAKGFV